METAVDVQNLPGGVIQKPVGYGADGIAWAAATASGVGYLTLGIMALRTLQRIEANGLPENISSIAPRG